MSQSKKGFGAWSHCLHSGKVWPSLFPLPPGVFVLLFYLEFPYAHTPYQRIYIFIEFLELSTWNKQTQAQWFGTPKSRLSVSLKTGTSWKHSETSTNFNSKNQVSAFGLENLVPDFPHYSFLPFLISHLHIPQSHIYILQPNVNMHSSIYIFTSRQSLMT